MKQAGATGSVPVWDLPVRLFHWTLVVLIVLSYAAIKLEINTRRWSGVPFYVRSGKRLGRRVTEVAVVFKRAPQQLFSRSQTQELGQNALVIRVQPDEGVTIRFGSKVPGDGTQVRDVTMDFGYGHAFTEASPEAYERLILDVLLGDQVVPLSEGEFEVLWLLASHAGEILSRDTLLKALRGVEYDGLDRSIDVAVSRLRKKLGDDPNEPHKIKTVRNKGYLFVRAGWDA